MVIKILTIILVILSSAAAYHISGIKITPESPQQFFCQFGFTLSDLEAKRIVNNLPEVKTLTAEVEKGGGRVYTFVRGEKNNYLAEVSEVFPDESEIFNRYIIDNCNGKIKCAQYLYQNGKYLRASQPSEYPCP